MFSFFRSKPKSAPEDYHLKINNDQYRQFQISVAGITHQNDDGSSRSKIAAGCKYGQKLNLVREPENQYDKNAVKILTGNGKQIGFLDSHNAKDFQATLKGTSPTYSHMEVFFIETGTFRNDDGKVTPFCKICIRRYYKIKTAKSD